MTLKSNVTKVTFFFAKHTVLKALPDHFKNLLEHVLLYGSKTEKVPFLHCKINGFILPAFITEEQLRLCTTFKTRPGDVFVVNYPKSGTVWLSQIIRCIVKPKPSEQENLLGGQLPMLEVVDHKKINALPSPRYLFTHLPFDLVPRGSKHDVKYIYLARNPKDLAVSQFHSMCSLPSFIFNSTWEKFLECFMEGNVPLGSYFDHVLAWWACKDDENVLFLKYEDLKKDIQGQVKIIAEFLGVQLSNSEAKAVAEKCTFQAMKANPNVGTNKFTKFFIKKGKSSHLRKGIVGDWENHFSNEQLEVFQKLYQSRMDGTGLEFEQAAAS